MQRKNWLMLNVTFQWWQVWYNKYEDLVSANGNRKKLEVEFRNLFTPHG